MAEQDNGGSQTHEQRKQTVIIIEGAGGQGESVFDKTETESLGETELGETTVIRLKHADGCGHVIHTAAEVGAVSVCGKVLCTKCAGNLCYRCGKPVCGEHTRRVKRDDSELVYCWRCWTWAAFEDWGTIGRWTVGVVALLMLLKLIRGC